MNSDDNKINFNNWEKVLDALEQGQLRAATNNNDNWVVDLEVKRAILDAFKAGKNISIDSYFVDKHNLPPQKIPTSKGVRIVPFGSTIRRGAYVAPGVIVMPPSYINVGAYVDEGSMVDSHVLVGSCAQIGKRVHLSAGVQIGGVLEPVGERPVIIEDDAFLGAGVVVVEGILVKRRAILAPGVILSKSLPIYDLVNNRILEKGASIPEGAVVVSGTRPVLNNDWAKAMGLSLSVPIIIKYRDNKSDASLVLEDLLRTSDL